ncbi:hypothetical protein H9Q69_007293 [Fusarium xylarioides]|nr:hypothetical protein H9Q70_006673 [Fusarium xylarioides]KAG5793643.1 hypothetical protein H9Q69_007293 [Fusarium xylarioides]KAG5805552.1 hypothetical protein H9Q71_009864 [Fusarium xylarioides]KAG5819547.1 hypothetical protein H9Q74_009415 [Fusarium xylarioides]
MSNSHLPNSHSDVTLTWRPYKFPRISLLDAIKTSSVADSDGKRYSGTVPPDWCGNGGRRLAAHGGYCATVLMMTAQQYIHDQNGGQGNMEPLNMSVEYLEPLPQGRFEIALETLSTGPPIFLNYTENGMEAASSWGIPTTALNIMFRSEVTPQDWLLTRTTMKRLHGGRFDMNVEILSEDGKLLASCVQICSVIPLGAPASQIAGKL